MTICPLCVSNYFQAVLDKRYPMISIIRRSLFFDDTADKSVRIAWLLSKPLDPRIYAKATN